MKRSNSKNFVIALIAAGGVLTSACSDTQPTQVVHNPATIGIGPPPPGGVGTPTGGDAVIGKVQVCNNGEMTATFTITTTPVNGGNPTSVTSATVEPAFCVLVATDFDNSTTTGANVTITETSPGLHLVTADSIGDGSPVVTEVPFSNGGTLFVSGALGYTVHFHNVLPVALFVIGDGEPHGVGATVNFWGAQWWTKNIMSLGSSNGVASFKGYASTSGNVCGSTWTSRPGNSSNPPNALDPEIAVIVTDRVNKNGSVISGNIKGIVLLTHDGQYGPNPGHPGSGVVSRVICGS